MARNRGGVAEAMAVQRARQLAGAPTAGFFSSVGGFLKKAVTTGIGFATGGVGGAVQGFRGAPTQQSAERQIFFSNQLPGARADCPGGFRVDPRSGDCIQIGFRGAVERALPFGQTGTLADEFGEAVVGAFGMPALIPAQVGEIQGRPILRCPRGAVLGKDSLCYQKGVIPIKFRKWRPARKPPISAKRWAELKGTATTKRMAKEIAAAAGFSCKKR